MVRLLTAHDEECCLRTTSRHVTKIRSSTDTLTDPFPYIKKFGRIRMNSEYQATLFQGVWCGDEAVIYLLSFTNLSQCSQQPACVAAFPLDCAGETYPSVQGAAVGW